MNFKPLGNIFLGAILLMPIASFAAEGGAVISLAPVTVIAAPANNPLQITLNPKKPQQPVPASDATSYLQTVPGFSAIRTGGTNGDMVFRGMFGSRLNVLTNGGYMFGGCGGRMDSPASYISPETYDSVQIIKGPQTVLWGGGGSAATVLFDRKAPIFSEPQAHIRASLLGASFDRYDQLVDAVAGTEFFYVRALANHARAGDYKDGSQNFIPSKWMKWNTDISFGLTPDSDTWLELSAGTGDGEARYADRMMDGVQFRRESFGLRFSKDNIGETLDKIEFQGYYNYIDHVMDNYSLRNIAGTDQSRRKSNPSRRVYGGRLAFHLNANDYNLLVSGMDAQFDEHRSRVRGIWDKNISYNKFGIFSELTSKITELSSIITGARLDAVKAKDHRILLANNDSRKKDILPSGFLRFEQNISKYSLMWYSGLGYAERFPDFWEISQANVTGSTKNAFSELKPEKTLQFDTGIQYHDEVTHAWLSAYAGIIRDYIMFHTASSNTHVQNMNALITGAELGFSRNIIGDFYVDLSLAWAWGEIRDTSLALPQTPPLEARLGLRYERESWGLGLIWRLVAPQKRVAVGYGNVKGKDFSNSDGFGVISINGRYNPTEYCTISAGIDNLLDKTYSEHLNRGGYEGLGLDADKRLNEPGINCWCKVTMEF